MKITKLKNEVKRVDHFRLYKSHKVWKTAVVTTLFFAGGTALAANHTNAHADTTTSSITVATSNSSSSSSTADATSDASSDATSDGSNATSVTPSSNTTSDGSNATSDSSNATSDGSKATSDSSNATSDSSAEVTSDSTTTSVSSSEVPSGSSDITSVTPSSDVTSVSSASDVTSVIPSADATSVSTNPTRVTPSTDATPSTEVSVTSVSETPTLGATTTNSPSSSASSTATSQSSVTSGISISAVPTTTTTVNVNSLPTSNVTTALLGATLDAVTTTNSNSSNVDTDGLSDRMLGDANVVASGNWGTAQWTVDNNNQLTITGGDMQTNADPDGLIPYRDKITSITFAKGADGQKVKAPVFAGGLFAANHTDDINQSWSDHHQSDGFTNLQSIDVSNLDTSNTTNMNRWFDTNTNLNTVYGFNQLDTSKVTDMSFMFVGAKIKYLDLSNLNMSSLGGKPQYTEIQNGQRIIADWPWNSDPQGGMFAGTEVGVVKLGPNLNITNNDFYNNDGQGLKDANGNAINNQSDIANVLKTNSDLVLGKDNYQALTQAYQSVKSAQTSFASRYGNAAPASVGASVAASMAETAMGIDPETDVINAQLSSYEGNAQSQAVSAFSDDLNSMATSLHGQINDESEAHFASVAQSLEQTFGNSNYQSLADAVKGQWQTGSQAYEALNRNVANYQLLGNQIKTMTNFDSAISVYQTLADAAQTYGTSLATFNTASAALDSLAGVAETIQTAAKSSADSAAASAAAAQKSADDSQQSSLLASQTASANASAAAALASQSNSAQASASAAIISAAKSAGDSAANSYEQQSITASQAAANALTSAVNSVTNSLNADASAQRQSLETSAAQAIASLTNSAASSADQQYASLHQSAIDSANAAVKSAVDSTAMSAATSASVALASGEKSVADSVTSSVSTSLASSYAKQLTAQQSQADATLKSTVDSVTTSLSASYAKQRSADEASAAQAILSAAASAAKSATDSVVAEYTNPNPTNTGSNGFVVYPAANQNTATVTIVPTTTTNTTTPTNPTVPTSGKLIFKKAYYGLNHRGVVIAAGIKVDRHHAISLRKVAPQLFDELVNHHILVTKTCYIYRRPVFKTTQRAYQLEAGMKLAIKDVVLVDGKTRLVLQNGGYVTGNLNFITPLKATRPLPTAKA